jgi:seryl-tRNA synthetase
MVNSIGNIVHESVPVENNEDFNKVDKTWGEKREIKMTGKPGGCHHH